MSDIIGAASPPVGIQSNFDHPADVFKSTNLLTQILCFCFVTPIVFLRIYTRARIQRSMNREDWSCLVAWLLLLPYTASSVWMGEFGGNHQWDLTELEFQNFMKAAYFDSVFYGPATISIKLTLLLIFTRLFANVRRMVILTNILIVSMLAFYLPMMIVKIRICTPISGFWNRKTETKCINESALFLADTVMSVVTDASVLLIPLPLLWMLKLPLKQRLRAIALLGGGAVAVSASIIRLVLLYNGYISFDKTVTMLKFNALGSAETAIGLICAGLPALNSLFTRYKNEQTRKCKMSDTESTMEMGKLYKKKMAWGKDGSIMEWTHAEVEVETEAEDGAVLPRLRHIEPIDLFSNLDEEKALPVVTIYENDK